jgi:hypothetical protein
MTMNDVDVPVTFQSEYELTATTPPTVLASAVGKQVKIVVKNPDGQTFAVVSNFMYGAPAAP